MRPHILPSELSMLMIPRTQKNNNLCIYTWPCRDKKTLLLSLVEELMMEAWLLKKSSYSPLPTFPLTLKLCGSSWELWRAPLPSSCKAHKRCILINHFLSIILFYLVFLCWDIKDWYQVLWNPWNDINQFHIETARKCKYPDRCIKGPKHTW